MVRRAAIAVAVLAAACSTGRRIDAVEVRLSAIESVQAKNHAATTEELRLMVLRLEALILELRTARIAPAGPADPEATAELAAKLDELAARIDELSAAVARAGAGAGNAGVRKRRPEPDGKDVYAVPIDGSPFQGQPDALVTIVRGYEYACPFCEKSRATMDALLAQYPDDVRIVYRHFIVHPQVATAPAQAACAAQIQGLFFEYDELLWTRAYAPSRDFSQTNLEKLAVEAGLDLDQFRADQAGVCVTRVQDDMADLKKVGQGATPTFFINGRYLSGAQSVTTFSAIIDEELALAKARVKKGARPSRYYKKWVLGKGKPEFKP